MNAPRPRSTLITIVVLAALYFLAGRIGLGLAFFHTSASPVWPPTGIAVAAFLLLGTRVWPAILLGAFLVNVTTTGVAPASAAIAVGNTLEGLIGAGLVRRFAGGREAFDHPWTIFLFMLTAGMLGPAVSATVGVTSLAWGGEARWEDFGRIWLTWWLGDACGAMLVTPLIVLWARESRVHWGVHRVLEAAGVALTLIAGGAAVFGGGLPGAARLTFLSIPPLLWAALRFTQREAATATFTLSAVAIAGTLRGLGAFALSDPNTSLLLLQAFNAVISVLVLVVAATVAERREAERRMRELNLELEARVSSRTEQLRSKIVEHAQAEDELRRSEARLREAQEVGRIGSWEWDVKDNVVWWSDELHRIYGQAPGVFGESYEAFLERVHPDDRQQVKETIETAFRSRQPFTFEHRIVRPDGEVLTLHARGRVQLDERGEVARMLGVGQDVTLQRRAEEERAQLMQEQIARQQAEESNRLKDEFLATLSHELRTPLHAITGWAELLREDQLDAPNRKKAIETIARNAQVQSRLISDILDLSRLDSGKVELARRPLRLWEVIEGAMDTLRPAANVKRIQLEPSVEDRELVVQGDAERIHQVVCNLLSNGIKFTPAGGRVRVALAERDGTAELRVEDDGPGIDPEFLPHVFERFRQRDSSSTRQHGGLGLGLAIVKRLVALHGGTVSASNRERGGARFVISLPCAAPPAIAPEGGVSRDPPRSDGTARPGRLASVRILVVDDDADSRELLVTLLGRQGAETRTASGVAEALRLFQESPPDLLVSDIEMPGESGYDLIAKVRALDRGAGGSVPAVALTAYADPGTALRTVRSGYQAHLSKPIAVDELMRTLSALVSASAKKDGRRLPPPPPS